MTTMTITVNPCNVEINNHLSLVNVRAKIESNEGTDFIERSYSFEELGFSDGEVLLGSSQDALIASEVQSWLENELNFQ